MKTPEGDRPNQDSRSELLREPQRLTEGLSENQTLPLLRLIQLQTRRRRIAGEVPLEDARLEVLDRATFSVYQDCRVAGLQNIADILLQINR